MGRFAIADGATEGFDSRRWARLLVRSWRSGGLYTKDYEELANNIKRLGDHLAKKWTRRKLPWYLEEKARMGAHAAFLGLEIFPNPSLWQAVAIGDCCLFWERNDTRLLAFPIDDPKAFNYRPILLPSKVPIQNSLKEGALIENYFEIEDIFLLLSDAISEWYLLHSPLVQICIIYFTAYFLRTSKLNY